MSLQSAENQCIGQRIKKNGPSAGPCRCCSGPAEVRSLMSDMLEHDILANGIVKLYSKSKQTCWKLGEQTSRLL